ncbi:hypothetical protein [Streptomyces sp. NPDC093707]|uniref:hypothetical protein n=1 Tax=Streptomyces sp. NPDC093707 TaxID=3154984 RepID=UPI00344F1C5B
MDATAHDHGTNHQSGRDQTINYNNYYGVPPKPERPPGVPGAGGKQHTVWIIGGGAVVGVALLAALLSRIGPAGTDGGTSGGPTAGPATASVSPVSSPSGSTSQPKPAPKPKPKAGTVRWQGTLLLDNSDVDKKKDLDANPPAAVDKNDAAADLSFWHDMDGRLVTDNGAVISEWTGGGLPSAKDCAGTVDAAGSQDLPIKTGKVFCLKTSDQRFGRLKVTKFWYDVAEGGATFDTVVWERG